jgi:hypothetical protein
VIITFKTPAPQSAIRVRSERGFHHIEATLSTNYHLQQQSPLSKSSLEKIKNEFAANQGTKNAEGKNTYTPKNEEDEVVIFKSDTKANATEEIINSSKDNSEESLDSLLTSNKGKHSIQHIYIRI